MRPARIILLIVALVAGGLAAYLVTRSDPAPETSVTAERPAEVGTQILVASKPIGIGERLTPDSVSWQDWPQAALRSEYVDIASMPDAPAELTGAVVRFEIFPGEPIREAKLVRADQGYLSAVLAEGMRGVSVGVTAVSSAGGFIVPNDHVDVLLTTTGAAGQQSELILSNVRVLAIGQQLGEIGTTGNQADPTAAASAPTAFVDSTIATLELTPPQAETLVNASTAGQLSLALRSVVDFNQSAEGSPTNQTVRLIRGGKEQSVQTGRSTAVASQQMPMPTPTTIPQPVLPSVAPQATPTIDPASVPL